MSGLPCPFSHPLHFSWVTLLFHSFSLHKLDTDYPSPSLLSFLSSLVFPILVNPNIGLSIPLMVAALPLTKLSNPQLHHFPPISPSIPSSITLSLLFHPLPLACMATLTSLSVPISHIFPPPVSPLPLPFFHKAVPNQSGSRRLAGWLAGGVS